MRSYHVWTYCDSAMSTGGTGGEGRRAVIRRQSRQKLTHLAHCENDAAGTVERIYSVSCPYSIFMCVKRRSSSRISVAASSGIFALPGTGRCVTLAPWYSKAKSANHQANAGLKSVMPQEWLWPLCR